MPVLQVKHSGLSLLEHLKLLYSSLIAELLGLQILAT